MSDHTHDHPDDGNVHVHVHSAKFYAGVLGALLTLTVLTVAVSYVDIDGFLALGGPVDELRAWNLGVAVLIATMKASLVVLFFMHLRDDKRFNALVFVGSLLFIGVFFAYTMNDTATRGQTGDRYNGVHIDPDTGLRAPGGIDREIEGEAPEAGLTSPVTELPDPNAPPASEGEAGAAEEAGETEAGAEGGDFIDDILGEEGLPEEAPPAEGEGGDFIDEIMGEEGGEPAPVEEPEPAGEPAPAEEPGPAEDAPAE